MRSILSSLTLLAAVSVAPAMAHATSFDTFTFVSNGLTVTTTLPTGVVVTPNYLPGDAPGYEIDFLSSATITKGANTEVDPSDYIQFYSSGASGGFSTGNVNGFPGDGLAFDDAQLGPTGAVLFTLGANNVINFTMGTTNFGNGVTATITPAATPEPSSLFLLGTGVLGLAGAARRRFTR